MAEPTRLDLSLRHAQRFLRFVARSILLIAIWEFIQQWLIT